MLFVGVFSAALIALMAWLKGWDNVGAFASSVGQILFFSFLLVGFFFFLLETYYRIELKPWLVKAWKTVALLVLCMLAFNTLAESLIDSLEIVVNLEVMKIAFDAFVVAILIAFAVKHREAITKEYNKLRANKH